MSDPVDRRGFLGSLLGLPFLAKLGLGLGLGQGVGDAPPGLKALAGHALKVGPINRRIFVPVQQIGFSAGDCLHWVEGPDSFGFCTYFAHPGPQSFDLGRLEVYENAGTTPDAPPAPVCLSGESPSEVRVVISDINGTRDAELCLPVQHA